MPNIAGSRVRNEHQIITGKVPFEELNLETAIIVHVVEGKLPRIRENMELSNVLQLCGLMSDCWASKPNERIGASTFQQKVHFMVRILRGLAFINSETNHVSGVYPSFW